MLKIIKKIRYRHLWKEIFMYYLKEKTKGDNRYYLLLGSEASELATSAVDKLRWFDSQNV